MPLGIPSLDCAEAELVVEPFQGGDRTWDDFVDKQQNASFCHLAAWRGIMSDVMRGRPLFLVALDDHGGWHGALPLVEIKSRL